jgi:hypothetical protein
MQRKRRIHTWLICMILIRYGDSLEILIKDHIQHNISGQSIESLTNQTYHVPLFETRYITVRIDTNDLRPSIYSIDEHIIGFKFQLQSTDHRVVEIKKEITRSTLNNPMTNIVLEDLFICK